MTTLTHEEQMLANLLQDDVGWLEAFVKIPNKSSVVIPFKLKPVQMRLARRLTGRDLVLKSSQIGLTTIASGILLKRTITQPNITSVIVAHEEFLTQRLLHRVQVMYDSVPRQLRPDMDHRSSFEMRFPDINSVLYIGTARSQVFGRGEPLHNVLFSEEAFYVADAHKRVIKPALQRVPPDGLVIRESTPNGEGDEESFYGEVQKALGGESTFNFHVFYWWDEPDNVLSSSSPRAPEADKGSFEYTEEEKTLVEANDLSHEQIRWRRWKIKEIGDLFWQEQVENLDSCFIVSGHSYYDIHRLSELSRECGPPLQIGIEGTKIWRYPEEGARYVMGVDPGQGKITDSVATVWEHTEDGPIHCATLAGKFEPELMAYKCMKLGLHYNVALLVPEANSHGMLFCSTAKNYPNIYRRSDMISGRHTSQIGWLTTPRTKPYMMQQMAAQLPRLQCADREIVRQIAGFREMGVGKVVTRSADDYHDSACLGMIGLFGIKPGGNRGYAGKSGFNW